MLSKWKVMFFVVSTLVTSLETSNSLTRTYPLVPYRNVPMFYPKRNYKRNRARQSRVLFLDDEERQNYGNGEIDLTLDKTNDQIKFDQEPDYDFTSPDETEENKNKRYYDALRRPTSFNHGFIPKYYQGRYGRPLVPSHYPFEPQLNFAPAVRNSFYSSGWKARSPRVVFPYQDGLNLHTNSHAGPGAGFNDNVVFRDTNFGLNEVPTDDLALQDLGTANSDAYAERDANESHRALKFYDRMDKTIRTTKSDKTEKHYIPVHRNRKQTKPMFIQTETTRILPPSLHQTPYEFTNITRDIGGRNAVLPKFKPISDEQMMKINQILKELPFKGNTIKDNRGKRRGKGIKDNTIDTSDKTSDVEVLEGQDRQDDKKCAQGGTCEFFFYCWMVGGLLEGTCGGLLKGCCHRVAKAGILGVQDSNSIDYSSESGLSYGPVINDESKSVFECLELIEL